MNSSFKQIFPLGEENINYAQYFIGQSYLANLAAIDGNVDVDVSNVTFEPGCHNHWHKHLNGYQILLATAGQGWYQEAGKPAQLLNPGDVVVIHAGVKHWHGATKDSWFSHVAITKGQSEWLEPVVSSDYNAL
ncbi:cupin domain-containing protein [Snodgrassella sp. B3088]|uniref:cupin domain-containing protein n=1 Tax=unclassified Snodgrassella TaxID=2625236 RepID=UPI002269CA9A|nr:MULTISPECIES: cupin domain-containing protein [unclassified Snodgrassella]MCX8748687.1 cupin domain-containing protein [Snodgrassella sp. B3088]MCX8753410.1 cupin domain-containing protein [Snodgrassella sp. B3837]